MGSRLEANSSAVRKRIEKHKFENEEGEEYGGSKFGGFTDYFRRKKIKLQNLDAERRASSAYSHPPIFRGVVGHVNGYTQPSLNDLHALIVDYGGGFMQYLDGKTTVTHIIASNLTPKKKIEFSKYRIVKPAWVVDSIEAGKLLPWENYRVVDEGVNQQVLGFKNGGIISQANSQYGGYRDQMETSWYTSQVKAAAKILDGQNADDDDIDIPFPSTQVDRVQNLEADHESEEIPSIREIDKIADYRYPHDGIPMREYEKSKLDPIVGLEQEFHINESKECDDTISPNSYAASGSGDNLSGAKKEDGSINHGSTAIQEVELKADVTSYSGRSPQMACMTAEEHNALLLADPKVWRSTVVNPGFLKQYYEESRLHHLSAWKSELKSQLQALASENSASQKSRRRPPGARGYILHVDFDSFFAAVSLKKCPQYADKPAVVAHGGGSGSEIASCNYPARKYGIKNGMWMKTAQQLYPDLKVLPYDFKAYEEASRDFYDASMNTGGIVQSVSVDECLIDISLACLETGGHEGQAVAEGSIWREQAKADDIALHLRNQVKAKTGCAVSVGIGGNILLAKVATRRAKPAGQYQIKPDEILDFVGALSVQDLPGVAWSIGGKLEEIGIKLVKDIRETSKEKLVTTLGPKTGRKLWDYSRGIDRVEVGEQPVRKSVSAEVNWGIRFVTQEQADEFVQSLCEELHKRLLNEGVRGLQLTMKIMRKSPDAPLDPPKHLGHGKCDTFNKSVVLGIATNAKEVLGREAISIMRGWGFPPGELRGIGVQMTKLEPIKRLGDLYAEGSQRRLQFAKSTQSPSLKHVHDHIEDSEDPEKDLAIPKLIEDPIDDIESPQKPKVQHIHPAATLTAAPTMDIESSNLLNTLGTQFVLPSQVDAEVLAELPADIRSKFLPIPNTTKVQSDHDKVEQTKSRSQSPAVSLNGLPTQSQLDQETLDALPADVRAEILAFYQKSPQKARTQSVLPQSPRKARTVKVSSKKLTTPTKKRIGLLSRGRPARRLDSNSTLTQSNFVALHSNTGNPSGSKNDSATEDISAEFLEALPEDIRIEVLAQQRRDRLKKRGGIDLLTRRKRQQPQAPQGQRRIRLAPRPPRPTFTGQNLSSLADLREAVSAWVEEFSDEEPYRDDVEALVAYLRRVIIDENDMAKAVSVAKWLGWIIGQSSGAAYWDKSLKTVQEGIQLAVKERGLGMVDF
ncbi:deoxycytidyl transferase [Xylographa opegraphella]|nr:deoxycytidyl transferase [Xylographa opegraphella]